MIKALSAMPLETIDVDRVLKRINELPEPALSLNARKRHLEEAILLPLPGAPDEAWRRIDIERLSAEIEKYAFSKPKITIQAGHNYVRAIETLDATALPRFQKSITRWHELAERRSAKEMHSVTDVRINKYFELAKATSTDGVYIEIPPNLTTHEPIIVTIENAEKRTITMPTVVIHAGKNSKASILISYSGSVSPNAFISVMRVIVEEGATIGLATESKTEEGVVHFALDNGIIGTNATLHRDIALRSAYALMQEGIYALLEPSAALKTLGVIKSETNAFAGMKLTAEQFAAHSVSDARVHAVLEKNAKAVFVGAIQIPKGAFKSEGYEQARALIIGENADITILPELEIIENDVKCSHGASVASINKEHLFYLASRGINAEKANALLIEAFSKDIIDKMYTATNYAPIRASYYATMGLTDDAEDRAAD